MYYKPCACQNHSIASLAASTPAHKVLLVAPDAVKDELGVGVGDDHALVAALVVQVQLRNGGLGVQACKAREWRMAARGPLG